MEKTSWTDNVRSEEVDEESSVLYTIQRVEADWIGHISRRNCLLKHIIKGDRGRCRSDGKTRKER